ncbi:MAG: hypothetical protein NVSMB65_12910 [Chloroflexota bacterium]
MAAEAGKRERQKSLYDLLGIAPSANAAELRRAYRQNARLCHPDLYPGDTAAASRFIHLKKAYDLLSDHQARARYDARLRREQERRVSPARVWFSAWSAGQADPATLARLREHDRMALAASLGAPQALAKLLDDPSPAVAASVVANPAASAPLVARGAAHAHWSVRRAAAARPDCPIPSLLRLAGDRERLVRLAVARNPAAPETALGAVRTHDDHDGAIALALARHPHTPDRLLALLAAHATEATEAALVERVPASRPALEVLATRPGGTRTMTAQALVAALDLVAALGLRHALSLWDESEARARGAGFWPPEVPAAWAACLGAARAARLRGRLHTALKALAVDAALDDESLPGRRGGDTTRG